MKKRLIVTIMLGCDPSYVYTKKSFKAYAKKVNADFLCIKKYKDIFKYIPANSFLKKLF